MRSTLRKNDRRSHCLASVWCVVLLGLAGFHLPALGQIQAAAPTVPHLVKYTGVVKDFSGKPLTGTIGLSFALYKDEQGGAPLWLETQNVQVDAQGHYSVYLGSTKSEGLPQDVFVSGE